MRLIDADALLTERMRSKYYHLPNGDTAIPLIDIEHAPTIEERKNGRWKIEHLNSDDGKLSFRFYRCTSCMCVIAPVLFVDKKFLRYCPNCGADMMEENKCQDQ